MRTQSGRTRRLLALLPLLAALAAAMALAVPALAHHDGGGFEGGPAGTIASFDQESGELVIDLAGGGQASGLVTQFTWIETASPCPGPPTARWHHSCPAGRRHHGDGHGWGWQYGHGETSALVPGATVEDALLFLKAGKAYFAKVELGTAEEEGEEGAQPQSRH